MIESKPGTAEAVRQGCKCVPVDQAAAIDAAVEEVLGLPSHHATGIPQWDCTKCPKHLEPDSVRPV